MCLSHAPNRLDDHIGKGKARGRGSGAERACGLYLARPVPRVAAPGISTLSMRKARGPSAPAPCWASKSCSRAMAASIWLRATVRPAAILCPPPLIQQPLAGQPLHGCAQIHPGTDRPDPLPSPRPARSRPRGGLWPLSGGPQRCPRHRDASPRPPPRPAGRQPARLGLRHGAARTAASISRRSVFSWSSRSAMACASERVVAGQAAAPPDRPCRSGRPHSPAAPAQTPGDRSKAAPSSRAHIGQRHQPGPFAPRHHPQALPHQGTVHPDQGRHIRHRRQRHQIQQGHQIRPLAPGSRNWRLASTSIKNTTQRRKDGPDRRFHPAGWGSPRPCAGGNVSPPRW
jgi:hypothetical protein